MQHVISVSARSKLSTVGAAPSLTQSSEPVVSGQSEQVGVEAAPIRGTRAGLVKDLAEIRADEEASAQSECRPIDLLHEMDIPEAYFEDSPEVIPVEELSTLPEVKEVEVPLPRIDGAGPDRDKLIAEQQADGTLLNILGLAKKSEKGYGFEQGVLVHCSIDSLGDSCQRVVVPKVRRDNVLELGHSSPVAGHFGCKKTYAKISKHFIWPRVWKDVKAFVKMCAGCQRAARNTNARAPLQPLPCVSEPFEKVAFDLVGPLPRTASGNKYILTMMCLFTKYPEAIPLRRVDNQTVLEAMIEIFSRHGLPKTILTDQGSVFMSKLTGQLWELLGVQRVRTSPYHPQSDGALERWHACLKGMLKRTDTDLKYWDRHLKYLLFVYRDTPHCVTGFSPFTLLFGRQVKGPLDLLRNSWLEGEAEDVNVSEWLLDVRARMSEMALIVSEREVKAKAEMKKFYDRSAKAKTFSDGEMMLVRKPGLHSKMGDSWDGPYQVAKQISPVTYRIEVPGKPSKQKVLHCNMLRHWHTPASKIHRIVAISEEEGEVEMSPGLKLVREGFSPSKAEQAMLDKVLSDYDDVLSSEPGLTDILKLSINTGNHSPLRNHPYRIPPRWKDEVRIEIDKLLELGIIRPSDSPWSSSIVTVGKKEGGVRICIDFRAINRDVGMAKHFSKKYGNKG